MFSIKRGDILLIDFPKQPGSCIIFGERPAVVVSNNAGNYTSMHINVVPFTSQKKKILPIHITIEGFGLSMRSIALTELVTSVDKSRVLKKIGSIAGTEKMAMIERCLCNQFGVA